MKPIILFLFLPLVSNSFCQTEFEFKHYVDTDRIGQKQIETDSDSTLFETTYLGKINMKENSVHSANITYHLLSQYYSVQAAIERHGHSRFIFLYESGKTARIYTLDMPEELPIAISDNKIKFLTGTVRYVSLPPLFCIPNGSCYEYND